MSVELNLTPRAWTVPERRPVLENDAVHINIRITDISKGQCLRIVLELGSLTFARERFVDTHLASERCAS